MKRPFNWRLAIIVGCIVMLLNIALTWFEHAHESLPLFLYYLAYIMDIPSIWINVLSQKIPSSGGNEARLQLLTACVTSINSALVWAVLVGIIVRRKSPAGTGK